MPQRRGPNRVNRGGSFNNTAAKCRSANRNANQPTNRNNNLGLRPAALSQTNRRMGESREKESPAGTTGIS